MRSCRDRVPAPDPRRIAAGITRAAPTTRRAWRGIGTALARAGRRPPATAAGVAGFLAVLTAVALPGRLGFVATVATGDLAAGRKLTAVLALYPPWSVRHSAVEGVLLVVVAGLVGANLAVLTAGLLRRRARSVDGGGSVVGGGLAVLGAGCSACGGAAVPLLGLGSAALLPFGGTELVAVAAAGLLVSLGALSDPPPDGPRSRGDGDDRG